MAIQTGGVRFLGNGRPTQPARGSLGVNRDLSRRSIQVTNARTIGEVQQRITSSRFANERDLGRSAVQIQKSTGRSINVTV